MLELYFKNIKRLVFLLIVVWLLGSVDVRSQNVHNTFSNMTGIAQSSLVNPAYLSKYKVVVAIPTLSIGVNFQLPLSYNQVLEKEGSGHVVDVSNILDILKDRKNIGLNTQVDILFASVRVLPKWHAHFYSSLRTQAFMTVPETVTDVLIGGNNFNTTYNVELKGEANSWLENGLGVSYQVNDRITAGVRFKLNRGIFGAKVNNAFGSFTTTEQLVKVSAEWDVQATDVKKINEVTGFENTSQYLGSFSVGLDLGATYNHDNKWWVGLALNNLIGSVNYQLSKKYTLPRTESTYDGISIPEAIDDKTVELEVKLSKKLQVTETEAGEFTNSLPTTYFLNGEYIIIPDLRVGGAFSLQSNTSDIAIAYGVHAAKDFGRILSLSLSFNRIYSQFSGGMGASLQLGPVQLYYASDNALSALFSGVTGDTTTYIKDTRALNFRFGVNLVFGRLKNQLQYKNI